MNVELWCPGPSLVPHPVKADVVVMVNRAVLAVDSVCDWEGDCDTHGIPPRPFAWWVANDAKLIRRVRNEMACRPDVWEWPDAVLTSELSVCETTTGLGGIHIQRQPRVVGDAALRAVLKQDFGNFAKSKFMALALCFQIGAKRVEVYGDDMSGEDDWDGPNERASRDEIRWVGERVETAKIIAWMAAHGCEVVSKIVAGGA